jgi:DUF2934 family protein
MARDETKRHQMKTADRSTDEPTSSAGENAIEGDSLSPHQSDADARHSRISEAAYRLAEARGFESGSDLDDWLEAEREVDQADQKGLLPRSGATPARSSSEESDSTTPGPPVDTPGRQQTRSEQDSQPGSSEIDEMTARRNANVAVPKRPADAK